MGKEEDAQSKDRLAKLNEELAKLRKENDELVKRWDAEKASIARVREVKKEIDAVKNQMEQAERDYDLNKMAELKYGRLPELQKELAALSKKDENGNDNVMLKEEVDEEDIAKVVSTWTGIPVARLGTGERAKLVHLEEILHEHVIGQDEAVKLSVRPLSVRVPVSRILTVRLVPLSSLVLPVSARPSWLRPWPRCSLMMNATWYVSI